MSENVRTGVVKKGTFFVKWSFLAKKGTDFAGIWYSKGTKLWDGLKKGRGRMDKKLIQYLEEMNEQEERILRENRPVLSYYTKGEGRCV